MISKAIFIINKVNYKLREILFRLTIDQYAQYKNYFDRATGIEIGGPSKVFHPRHYWPVYADAGRIDGVNFSNETMWEGSLQEGATYDYTPNKVGKQFIMEAGNLSKIPDETYDFLISSHCLEHCANPIAVLLEWKRVVKQGGLLLIVVPDSRYTFDWKRPITKFEHLLSDFQTNTNEGDLTHLNEILMLHDLTKDPGAKSPEAFQARSRANKTNRGLHHHLFDIPLLEQLFRYTDINILMTAEKYPHHLFILGKKA